MNFNLRTEEYNELSAFYGEAFLKTVLKHAEPGWFSRSSWEYWHERFYGLRGEEVPAMPVRIISKSSDFDHVIVE